MTKFKELFLTNSFQRKLEFPSVIVSLKEGQTLSLRLNSKDIIQDVAFEGKSTPWLTSMCYLLLGKSLADAYNFSWSTWDETFKDDQSYWDFKNEEGSSFICTHLELLRAALDLFRGKESLYSVQGPLVCRCFGIREDTILAHLKNNEVATLESLTGETKAGMGCRSCVPQLSRWVAESVPQKFARYYKERPVSEWMLLLDETLQSLKEYQDFSMELVSFEKGMLLLEYKQTLSQKEEELLTKKIQDYLRGVDPDLSVFLRVARHFSNAKG